MLEKLPAFHELRGIDVVSDVELSMHPTMISLEALSVDRGQRRVISRRYGDMTEALEALPTSLLAAGLGQLEFFAVNEPAEGVHVLLGAFDNVADLDYALAVANSGATGDFVAVTNKGRRGGFYEP